MGDIGSIPCFSILQKSSDALFRRKVISFWSWIIWVHIISLSKQPKHYRLFTSTRGVYQLLWFNHLLSQGPKDLLKSKRIHIQICVSVLQNGGYIGFIHCVVVLENWWVTLVQFYVLVFYKMDGLYWVPLRII